MIPPISPMDKRLENLFPAALRKGVQEIFGKQLVQPVLLGLLPAPIEETAAGTDWSPTTFLHPNEAAILGDYRFAKRRSEYLSGRLCAKIAVRQYLQMMNKDRRTPALTDIEIAKADDGRPEVCLHLREGQPLKVDISISHSGEYASALASGAKCGIDLQRQEASLLRVQERYCSMTEFQMLETFLQDFDVLARLALLWAAKEAAKKVLNHWRMPGFLDLQLRELSQVAYCFALTLHITNIKDQQMPQQVTVAALPFGDYALAVCLVNKDIADA